MSNKKLVNLSWIAVAVLWSSALPAAEKGVGRAHVPGGFLLTLGGVKTGFVKSVDGGAVSAEVVSEPAGSSNFVKKHLGQPRYEDVVIQIGFGNKAVYDWVAASWRMNAPRKDLAVTTLDGKMQPSAERQYMQALLAETTIPAMDASSKEPAYVTLRISPEIARSVPPSPAGAGESGKIPQKAFLPANFKLEIAGLDCTKVTRIEPFTVKQTMAAGKIGGAQEYQQQEPGKLQFPNLQITLAQTSVKSWTDWFEEFVVKGNNDEAKEKNGTLILLTANGQDEMARISFFNMGIFRLSPAKGEADVSASRMVAELYVERMEFALGKGAVGGASRPAAMASDAAASRIR